MKPGTGNREPGTVAAALVALCVASASLGAQTIAITGGTVYPVSGPRIENGTVLVRDGRIVAVGANVTVPANAQRIDATGKWVTPGFINSGTQIGVVEIGFSGPQVDVSARGRDNVAAAFRVWEGMNPLSVLIPPARADGITSVLVAPNGGLVSGQAALVDLIGPTVTEMIRKAPAAMIAELGDAGSAGVNARGEVIGKLRELLVDTRAYMRRRAAIESGQSRVLSASRADLEAMVPVLEGRLPLVIATDRASDIEAAITLANEERLRVIIAGGAEAWMVAEKLAAARIPVLTGAMNNIPGSFNALGMRQENPGLLARAGVRVALVGNAGGGDEELFNVRNVRFEAGNAVAYGMTWDDALRAVTLTPAEVFGVADRVGSLQTGRDANLVIWNGDPFELQTRAERVLVRGREASGPTRQDMLEQRYRRLPPAYRPD
jgi:imidazolonepropionase-like amidohydrolase